MKKGIHWQNSQAASVGKRRANAAAEYDRVVGDAQIIVDPAKRIDLNGGSFSYDDLDTETRIVMQQRATEIRERMRATAENIVAVGEKLSDVQARLASHYKGVFQAWIQHEFAWSLRTAYNFIAVHKQFGSYANFAQLDIALSALYMLAAPSTPQQVFDEILDRAGGGEVITPTDVKLALSAHHVPPGDDDEETIVEPDPTPLNNPDDDEPTQPIPAAAPMSAQSPAPPHGLEVGRTWLITPGGEIVKVVGIGGGSVFLLNANGNGGTHKAIEEVAEWQKTDAPPAEQRRPFVSTPPAPPPSIPAAAVRGTCPRCGDVTLFEPTNDSQYECQTCLESGIGLGDIVPLTHTHARATLHVAEGGSAFCRNCGTLHNRWTAMQQDGEPVWMCAKCGSFSGDIGMLLAGVSSPAPAAPPRSLTRGMTSSDTSEWYTPQDLMERVRACLGGAIMLDPASCEEANRIVGAKQFFDKKANGLTHPWTVWTLFLNPPYGSEIGDWIAYLVEQHQEGTFAQALTLIPARTDTPWYRLLREYPRVFIHGRLAFWNASSSKSSAPFPSVIVGLGVTPKALKEHFGDIGDVLVPYK